MGDQVCNSNCGLSWFMYHANLYFYIFLCLTCAEESSVPTYLKLATIRHIITNLVHTTCSYERYICSPSSCMGGGAQTWYEGVCESWRCFCSPTTNKLWCVRMTKLSSVYTHSTQLSTCIFWEIVTKIKQTATWKPNTSGSIALCELNAKLI